MEEDDVDANSSDEDEPESVSFGASKEASLLARQELSRQQRAAKDKLKQKRRLQHEMFASQKKQKLDSLRIDPSILSKLAPNPSPQDTTQPAVGAVQSKDVQDSTPMGKRTMKKAKSFPRRQEVSGIQVKPLKSHLHPMSHNYESALSFKQKALSQTKRMSSKGVLAVLEKRAQRSKHVTKRP